MDVTRDYKAVSTGVLTYNSDTKVTETSKSSFQVCTAF